LEDEDDRLLSLTPFGPRKTSTAHTLKQENGFAEPCLSSSSKVLATCSTEGSPDGNWKPMAYWYFWDEFGTLTPRLNVTMSLPSGITYEGSIRSKVEAKVSECGKKLIVKCLWPSLLCDTATMKEGFRHYPMDEDSLHAMVHAATMALAKLRKSMGFERNQAIYSTTVIELPEEVEANLPEPVPIQDETGGAVLHVLLHLRKESMEAPEHALVVRTVSHEKNNLKLTKKKKVNKPKKYQNKNTENIRRLIYDTDSDDSSMGVIKDSK
jgi:hypothetical protein